MIEPKNCSIELSHAHAAIADALLLDRCRDGEDIALEEVRIVAVKIAQDMLCEEDERLLVERIENVSIRFRPDRGVHRAKEVVYEPNVSRLFQDGHSDLPIPNHFHFCKFASRRSNSLGDHVDRRIARLQGIVKEARDTRHCEALGERHFHFYIVFFTYI
jgi:hypothetical protein